MTLPSRYRTRNWCLGGMRPNTLPLGHGGSTNIECLQLSWDQIGQIGVRTRDLRLSKQAAVTTAGPSTIICDQAHLSVKFYWYLSQERKLYQQ